MCNRVLAGQLSVADHQLIFNRTGVDFDTAAPDFDTHRGCFSLFCPDKNATGDALCRMPNMCDATCRFCRGKHTPFEQRLRAASGLIRVLQLHLLRPRAHT